MKLLEVFLMTPKWPLALWSRLMKAEQEMSQLSNRFATVGDTEELDLKRVVVVVVGGPSWKSGGDLELRDITRLVLAEDWKLLNNHRGESNNDVAVIWFLRSFRYSYIH